MKIERPSLKEQIFNILRRKIIEAEIKPGEVLVESEIARNFGVSRGPVHDALCVLESEGFLSRGENGSLFVTVLTKKDVHEIYSLRSVIEGLAARIAVVNFNNDDIRYLEKCLENIAELKNKDGVVSVPNNMEIHRFVMEKANHKRAYDLWKNFQLQHKMLAFYVMSSDSVEDALIKHTKLVEVLKTKNPDNAEKAMKDHIMDAWEITNRYLKNFPDGIM